MNFKFVEPPRLDKFRLIFNSSFWEFEETNLECNLGFLLFDDFGLPEFPFLILSSFREYVLIINLSMNLLVTLHISIKCFVKFGCKYLLLNESD